MGDFLLWAHNIESQKFIRAHGDACNVCSLMLRE